MTDIGDLRIPTAMRPAAEKVIALTDAACAELLDQEYAGLARHVVAKLARKRPSPLQSGRPATWAGGVVYALGQVNFLFDRSSEPHVTHDDLADAFGLSKSTLSQKAKQIRDILKMSWSAPEFLSAAMTDYSPMVWFIEVDGLIYDARQLIPEVQVEAYLKGLIPYIPDLGREGTARAMAGQRSLRELEKGPFHAVPEYPELGFEAVRYGAVLADFGKSEPPHCTVIIDESVLLRPIGGPQIMHDQLMHLAEMAGRPNVMMQVVPFGANAGLCGGFMIASTEGTSDVAIQESLEDVTSGGRAFVRKAGIRVERVRGGALPVAASRIRILEGAEEWKSKL